jgi:hypothetical protein
MLFSSTNISGEEEEEKKKKEEIKLESNLFS